MQRDADSKQPKHVEVSRETSTFFCTQSASGQVIGDTAPNNQASRDTPPFSSKLISFGRSIYFRAANEEASGQGAEPTSN
jgi:hypothetical protein